MSAEENPRKPEPLRAPLRPLWATALGRGLLGLLLGLVVALVFVVLDHRKANTVSKVFIQARVIVLQYQGEKGAWPKDFDLSAPGDQFGGFKLEPLLDALAKSAVPGKWAFVAKPSDGVPSVVFTPAEPDRGFRRVLDAVDHWLDDGDPATGDLRVREGEAVLRLSAE
jgi:hypothetical protein